MSRQPNLWDTPNATFLPESADGQGPCASPDGPMTAPCGPEVARANLSARQAGERGLLTSGTYGHTGSTSSGSAGLQSFLERKLRANLPYPGLTLFSMTWKQRVTPVGRLICALRASGRRTSGSGCGSWVSPTAQDHSRGTASPRPWDTGVPLSQQVALSSWPTPSAQGSAGEISEDLERRGEKWVNKKTGRVLQTNLATDVKMMGPWCTPKAGDAKGTMYTRYTENGLEKGRSPMLQDEVQLASWPTPSAAIIEAKSKPPIMGNRKPTDPQIGLADVAVHLSGTPANGSPAGTGSGGQLNPAFSLWLMGYSAEWDD